MIKTAKTRAIHKAIEEADAVVITAGAGMGVDSGLPDFRGNKGFWRHFPELEKLGIGFAEIATPYWFVKKPELAWAFYGYRLFQYRKVVPHAGFNMLLDYVKAKNENYFIVTSNVDGHFQKAGFDPDRVHEVHGSLTHFQCTDRWCSPDIWSADYSTVKMAKGEFKADQYPLCPKCGKAARPNVLMFNDENWIDGRTKKQELRFIEWRKQTFMAKQRVVIIEIGAGVDVYTIRRIGESLHTHFPWDTTFIRINPKQSKVPSWPDGAYGVKKTGLEGIKKILMAYKGDTV